MIPTTVTLPKTKSNAERLVTFLPASVPDHNGTLVMVELQRKRKVTETYRVEEQHPDGYPGRVFLLLKDGMAGDDETVKVRLAGGRCGEVYQCRVPGRSGVPASCTCKAGLVGRHDCKHATALRMLAEKGW